MPEGVRVLFEDPDIIVCFKRAGIAVESAKLGNTDLVSALKVYLREKNPEGGVPYLGVVHRLDQPVQGLIVFAKTPSAAADLSRQAAGREMKKVYRALVYVRDGARTPDRGRLEDMLVRDGRTNMSRVVQGKVPGARKAVLEYELLERRTLINGAAAGEDSGEPAQETVAAGHGEMAQEPGAAGYGEMALAQITLLTGRHHQIRVQMAHAGMPLAGDRKYGTGADDGRKYPALCAFHLEFDHPSGKGRCAFSLDENDYRLPENGQNG